MSFQRNVGAADNEFGIVFTERVDEAFQTVLVASAMIFCWGAVVRLDIDFGRPVTQVGIEKNLLPVAENFSGSLPAFLTAFTRGKKLSEEEIAQLQKLIDQSRG